MTDEPHLNIVSSPQSLLKILTSEISAASLRSLRAVCDGGTRMPSLDTRAIESKYFDSNESLNSNFVTSALLCTILIDSDIKVKAY